MLDALPKFFPAFAVLNPSLISVSKWSRGAQILPASRHDGHAVMKFTAGVLADGTVTSHAQRSTEWANKKAAGILALRPPGSKLAGFEIAAAAPVLSTLSKFSRCVESEILFLD